MAKSYEPFAIISSAYQHQNPITGALEAFNFQHHNNNEDLKAEIQQILDNNPDRMQDFYKIARALIC